MRVRPAHLFSGVVLVLAMSGVAGATTIHGFCGTNPAQPGQVAQCQDASLGSETSNNPPLDFGFNGSGHAISGTLLMEILVPNNEDAGIASFSVVGGQAGTPSGTATLFSSTQWASGQLQDYLGISASPVNPIGNYLTGADTFDPGATGFFVYQVGFPSVTLSSTPNVGPYWNFGPGTDLPEGSFIVGFIGDAQGFTATPNSAAILEDTPALPVPEPATLALFGSGLAALGVRLRRRKA